jgi:hypothetical protein
LLAKQPGQKPGGSSLREVFARYPLFAQRLECRFAGVMTVADSCGDLEVTVTLECMDFMSTSYAATRDVNAFYYNIEVRFTRDRFHHVNKLV